MVLKWFFLYSNLQSNRPPSRRRFGREILAGWVAGTKSTGFPRQGCSWRKVEAPCDQASQSQNAAADGAAGKLERMLSLDEEVKIRLELILKV